MATAFSVVDIGEDGITDDMEQSCVRKTPVFVRSLGRSAKQGGQSTPASAMVAGIESAHWRETQKASSRNWSLHEFPVDIRLSWLHGKVSMQAGNIGDAAFLGMLDSEGQTVTAVDITDKTVHVINRMVRMQLLNQDFVS